MKLKYEKLSEILKALAHPARLKIVAGLTKNECCVSKIQRTLGLPQSTISQHLRILRNIGIIKGRKERTRRCYRVVDNYAKKIIGIVEK